MCISTLCYRIVYLSIIGTTITLVALHDTVSIKYYNGKMEIECTLNTLRHSETVVHSLLVRT